jgi:AcrR family transcriptional regulator
MQQEMGRRERKKLQTKKKISEITLKLFFSKGLNETTVAEIMEEADLGTGTFYNYFDSKEAILKYCLAERIENAQQYTDLMFKCNPKIIPNATSRWKNL